VTQITSPTRAEQLSSFERASLCSQGACAGLALAQGRLVLGMRLAGRTLLFKGRVGQTDRG
jgi:hypothetical protein